MDSGLINYNKEGLIIHPKYDKLIPLDIVNKFFFGINDIPYSTCYQYLELNNITINYNKKHYLILSKLSKYFKAVGDLENQMNNYIIINYYKFIEKELSGIQKDIYNFNTHFIKYIEHKKPIFYNIIINNLGESFFNGCIVNYEKLSNSMVIKYDDLIIYYGYYNLDIKLFINIKDYDSKTFQKLYQDIKQFYLMKDINKYVAYNLTKITKNEAFSNLLVITHNKKTDFLLPVDTLNLMILFKNDVAKNNYMKRFTEMYKKDTIWTLNEESIYLNFEGFNKYFLNIEVNDLDNIEMKEIINDLYFSITNELINSYKSLYN
jgi:hypothetical protein